MSSMNKLVPVRIINVLKACRNSLNVGANVSSQLTTMGMGTGTPPPLKSPSLTLVGGGPPPPPPNDQLLKVKPPPSSFYGNPCLDLFFEVFEQDTKAEAEANRMYLQQLLPLAWSHNPLTTLKLICNLLDRHFGSTKYDDEGFYTAAFWLHHNHPKTLASNLLPISGSFGGLGDLVEILTRILAGKDLRRSEDGNDSHFTENMFATANKVAVERYQNDSDYGLLHDRVSDLFVHCLKRDIQILKKHNDDHNIIDGDDHDHDGLAKKWMEITMAADNCDDRATFLCDSIARKVFFPADGAVVSEDAYRVRQRLRKEVLMPLRKALDRSKDSGYSHKYDREPCPAHKYLEDVNDEFKIVGGALLPHQIIRYADDENVGQAAELQWKAMVEDMKEKKKKNLSNCLAVCDVSPARMRGFGGDVSVGLGLLVSELSEEPAWKGKVINFSRSPKLHSISIHDDLKSQCAFVKGMDCQEWEVDFRKVFDLILEVAVKGSLKAEQMISKVFVFTGYQDFDEASEFRWESDYEAILSKFKEKGYGDVVPQIVFWDVKSTAVTCKKQGVAMFSGYSNDLVKSFLENDGEIGPEQVMEAAISAQPYQSLVVVD